jgi:hypothetical protein
MMLSGVGFNSPGITTTPGAGTGGGRTDVNSEKTGGYTGSILLENISGSSGNSTTAAGNGGSAGRTGASVNGSPLGDIADAPFGLPSTSDESTRNDAADESADTSETTTDEENAERCARGSSSYADVGQTEGKTGAPANVFELCSKDLQSSTAAPGS